MFDFLRNQTLRKKTTLPKSSEALFILYRFLSPFYYYRKLGDGDGSRNERHGGENDEDAVIFSVGLIPRTLIRLGAAFFTVIRFGRAFGDILTRLGLGLHRIGLLGGGSLNLGQGEIKTYLFV